MTDASPQEQVVVNDTPADVAATPEETSEFARLVQSGAVSSIRVIGDSITEGYCCDGWGDFTENVIYEGEYGTFYESVASVRDWANEFRAYAAEKGIAFVNAGISGSKMQWLAEDCDAWVREGADAIFVMLGTNDAVYHDVDTYRDYAEAALTAVRERCSHMVVMAPPNNAWDAYESMMTMAEVEQTLREISQAHEWPFVSMYDVIKLGSDMVNEDQCHPTTKGSLAIWEKLRSELGL